MRLKKDPIFDSDDRGQSSAKNALAKLFRGFLCDLGVTFDTWNKLLTRYVNNDDNGIPRSRRAYTRGNMPDQLLGDKISFKMFCRGLRALEADKADVYVVLHRGNRRQIRKIRIHLGSEVKDKITSVKSNVPLTTNVDELVTNDSAEAE